MKRGKRERNLWRIAIVADKVMPYRTALYRKIASSPMIDLTVLFLDQWGYEKRYDPTMGIELSWGTSVVEGFKYVFLKGIALTKVTYTGVDQLEKEMHCRYIGRLIFYLRTFFGILCLKVIPKIARSDFDAVIVEGYHSVSLFMASISAMLSGKIVFLRTEADLGMKRPVLLRMIKYAYLRLLFSLFDRILYSSSCSEDYYAHYGIRSDYLTFVPSAVDNEFFKKQRTTSNQKASRIRQELGISDDMIVVLGVGRMVKRKKWDHLIKAFETARRQNNKLALILVGDGPEYNFLQNRVMENNIDNVFLVGFMNQSQIVDYYETADILAQTSEYDPSPKVLNEAINFGLPLLVSDKVGTARDLCIDRFNGFIFEHGNTHALAKKLLFLSIHHDVREEFGSNSLTLVDEWSLDTCVKNIEALLNTLG